MKHLPISLLWLLMPAVAQAAGSAIALTPSWSGTLMVPDNHAVGASSSVVITAPGWDRIESVTMQLEMDGGWNGDLYGYLEHDGKLAMLMNRPGRTAANPDGFGSTGMTVTFSDLAPTDIHLALADSGVATGLFQPDGRLTDPLAVLDTDARTALLSVFTDENPNGTWTLFLADQGPGDTSTLKRWSLSVTAVPEASTALMLGLAAMAMAVARRRGA